MVKWYCPTFSLFTRVTFGFECKHHKFKRHTTDNLALRIFSSLIEIMFSDGFITLTCNFDHGGFYYD